MNDKPHAGDTAIERFRHAGLDERVGPSLLCVARLLERRLVRAMGEAGIALTPAQARILVKLHFHAPMSQQELAGALDVEPSTLVGTLDVMEREELARREPNPSDRRAHLVHTTEKGEALMPQLFGLWNQVEGELVEVLSETERARFQKSLSRLIERLSSEAEP
jgi:MarR family transcriptional regulator, transcriptional regulator for hemolysin